MYLREVDIIELIGQNYTRVQIGEKLAEKWDVSPFSIYKQYDETIKQLQEDLSKERGLLSVTLIERNNEIFRRCMLEGKYKTALDANNLIAKIAGIYKEDASKDADKPKVIMVREEDQSKPKLVSVEGKVENE